MVTEGAIASGSAAAAADLEAIGSMLSGTFRIALAAAVTAVILIAALWLARGSSSADREPVRVGILHSLTGTMADSESTVVDATLLAIEELNAEGGVLGRQIEPVVADGRSEPSVFAREAERLIDVDQVVTVFGCWTSASRKTVVPLFEDRDHLLVYPVQYEGLEQSPAVVYTGAAPNQQILPAVEWAFSTLGNRRFFLVGSDYGAAGTASGPPPILPLRRADPRS